MGRTPRSGGRLRVTGKKNTRHRLGVATKKKGVHCRRKEGTGAQPEGRGGPLQWGGRRKADTQRKTFSLQECLFSARERGRPCAIISEGGYVGRLGTKMESLKDLVLRHDEKITTLSPMGKKGGCAWKEGKKNPRTRRTEKRKKERRVKGKGGGRLAGRCEGNGPCFTEKRAPGRQPGERKRKNGKRAIREVWG